MCYKQVISNYSASKGPPFRNCNVQVFCFQRGPQTPLKCVSTLLSNFIAGPLKETVVCKYFAFEGTPDSNCNL